jgi:FAD synthase
MPLRVHAPTELLLAGCILTIGAFDGVHRGHQRLVGAAVASARLHGLPAVVYTFDPPPKVAMGRVAALSSRDEKIDRLGALGPDHIVVAAFNESYRMRSAQAFVAELGLLNPQTVWVGAGFRFGAGRAGDANLLRRYFVVRTVAPLRSGGVIISSSRIRSLRERGDLAAAEALLGWRGLRPTEGDDR